MERREGRDAVKRPSICQISGARKVNLEISKSPCGTSRVQASCHAAHIRSRQRTRSLPPPARHVRRRLPGVVPHHHQGARARQQAARRRPARGRAPPGARVPDPRGVLPEVRRDSRVDRRARFARRAAATRPPPTRSRRGFERRGVSRATRDAPRRRSRLARAPIRAIPGAERLALALTVRADTPGPAIARRRSKRARNSSSRRRRRASPPPPPRTTPRSRTSATPRRS